MSGENPILEVSVDGSLDRFEPVAIVESIELFTDGKHRPAYWMTAAVLPMFKESTTTLNSRLSLIIRRRSSAKWVIRHGGGKVELFVGVIRYKDVDFSRERAFVDFKLIGPMTSLASIESAGQAEVPLSTIAQRE